MSFEILKKTKSYQRLSQVTGAYFGIFFVFIMFIGMGFAEKRTEVIIIFALSAMVIFYFFWQQYKELIHIKKYAHTYELCEARVVNIESVMGSRSHIGLVVEFDDQMGEHHRMDSHRVFIAHESSIFFENVINIYYSSKSYYVLIDNMDTQIPKEIKLDEAEEDPYKL